MKMKTQDRLDCLLKHLNERAEYQGDDVVLNEQDVRILMKRCGFVNQHEIGFYIRSLEKRDLVIASCSGDNLVLEAQITIDGYRHLDEVD